LMGRDDLAEQDLAAAIAYNPTPPAFLARANFRQLRRQYDRALSDFEETIRRDPSNYEAHFGRGLILLKENPTEAIRAFDASISSYPHWANAYVMRARAFRALHRTDEAVADFERAIAVNPNWIETSLHALRHAGYWRSSAVPQGLTPEYRDAIRACMLDERCN
jgi:tetratricopeptide (TPR) repeat protein